MTAVLFLLEDAAIETSACPDLLLHHWPTPPMTISGSKPSFFSYSNFARIHPCIWMVQNGPRNQYTIKLWNWLPQEGMMLADSKLETHSQMAAHIYLQLWLRLRNLQMQRHLLFTFVGIYYSQSICYSHFTFHLLRSSFRWRWLFSCLTCWLPNVLQLASVHNWTLDIRFEPPDAYFWKRWNTCQGNFTSILSAVRNQESTINQTGQIFLSLYFPPLEHYKHFSQYRQLSCSCINFTAVIKVFPWNMLQIPYLFPLGQ